MPFSPASIVLVQQNPVTNLETDLTAPSAYVDLQPSTEFLNLMESINATRRGATSWALSTINEGASIIKFFSEYQKNFHEHTLFPDLALKAFDDGTVPSDRFVLYSSLATYAYSGPLNRTYDVEIKNALERENIRSTQIPSYVNNQRQLNRFLTDRNVVKNAKSNKVTFPGVVSIEIKNNLMWVRLHPTKSVVDLQFVNVHRAHKKNWNTKNKLVPITSKKDSITEYVKKIENAGFVVDKARSEYTLDLVDEGHQQITVGYKIGEPAQAEITVGQKVRANYRTKIAEILREKNGLPARASFSKKIDIKKVIELKATLKDKVIVHPNLIDVGKMISPTPFVDTQLRDYQNEAVSLHLSTMVGYVQTCSPGMGKTVIQLSAMRERAKNIPYYRGLVVSEANVRGQWKEEAAKWFPEAETVIIINENNYGELIEKLSSEKPVIVLCAYSFAAKIADEKEAQKEERDRLRKLTTFQLNRELDSRSKKPVEEVSSIAQIVLNSRWDDICADEAMVIRNGSSKQSTGMWILRDLSDVGVPLTGTPINKSANDLANLVAWARNDRSMFYGIDLEQKYDVTNSKSAKKLLDSFGPLVFRRDISEAKEEMPTPTVSTVELTPTSAEKALAYAAEKELRRCYEELVTAVETLEQTNATDDELRLVKEALKEARGSWIGGTQLARMALSDPIALMGSESSGAALLHGQGLIEAATVEVPTKRKFVIEKALKCASNNEQMLVFTEFASVARILVQGLREAGLRAEFYAGGVTDTKRNEHRNKFQNNEIDVLVCTKAGERGLTLHNASVILNYDIPWTPDRIIQRAGRALRFGSKNKQLEILYLIMKDTAEERVFSSVAGRGAAAILILDQARGVDISKTETGIAMSGLMSNVGKRNGNDKMIELGRLLFGNTDKTEEKKAA